MAAPAPFPVILPSETQSREFDAKLLLAGCLAERGHPVYVGSRVEIHNRIQALPRGLYLAKDVRRSSRRMFRIMHKLGFAIVAWDEEAIIVTDPTTFHKSRIDEENLNRIKAFFALGVKNRELIETAPGYRNTPIYETGNPRIDLLRPQCRHIFDSEVDALRARFGEFILINSNFGRLNHLLTSDTAIQTPDGGFINLGAGTSDWWAFRVKLFTAFKALLPALARAFPDRHVVLRPHPSEAHEVWREAARGLSNVTVVHEGNVYPWIMASAVAIHNGCTTGLESYLMDHPVITYQPVTSDEFDGQLPNRVSAPVFSLEQMISTLESLFAGVPLPPVRSEAGLSVEHYVGPLDGTLASERIDALIAKHGEEWMGPRPSLPIRMFGYAGSVSRHVEKTINSFRSGHKNSRSYAEHRFPVMSQADVEVRLGRLSKVLDRFSKLIVRQIHPNIFRVSDGRRTSGQSTD
ncbi:MAG TPA: surface carbohydrate biosynthesis protein [Hyphomicrobiaceae bacterium]|nr:surface carbohydrate biosynthesis protein [Hyphomicrobiaceae bacterium]